MAAGGRVVERVRIGRTRVRWSGLAVIVALVATLAGTAKPSAAAGQINVSATSVAVGGSIDVRATGCSGGSDDVARYPEYWIITGTGSAAVVATDGGEPAASGRTRLTIPGWVDPAQPAYVAARCMEQRQAEVDGRWTITRAPVSTYAEVPIDVTAPTGPVPTITASVSPTTADQGQTFTVTGSGCPAGHFAAVRVLRAADLSGRGGLDAAGGDLAAPGPDGSFAVEVTLNGYDARTEIQGVDTRVPVPVGPHALLVECFPDRNQTTGPTLTARPTAFTVAGANPTASHRITFPPGDTVVIVGEGCTGGRVVDLDLDGQVQPGGGITGQHTVTPAADGSWSFTIEGAGSDVELDSHVRCGDPSTTGFAYVDRSTTDQGQESAVTAVDPAVADPGQVVAVTVTGTCGDDVRVEARSGDEVVSRSEPVVLGPAAQQVELTAPTTPGTYTVIAPCRRAAAQTATLTVRSVATAPTGATDPGPGASPAVPVSGTATYAG